jgi:hypothetical protein
MAHWAVDFSKAKIRARGQFIERVLGFEFGHLLTRRAGEPDSRLQLSPLDRRAFTFTGNAILPQD